MASKDLACIADDDLYPHEGKCPRLASQDEFVLTKVVGLTNISKNALDCNQVSGYIAFPASCMLVLLDPKTNDQKFLESPSGKSISCVCFSDDGRLMAFGETGLKPYVSVWSLKDHKEHGKFVVDHSVGVKTIAINPKSYYVVVIGLHDLNIGVWDYVRCQRLALTKWQTIPLSMTIPKSGSSVILCGHRKITLFNLDKVNSNSYETNVFEDRKAVLLGRQSEYTFVDITSGKGKFDKNVYTVTTCGYLCEIKLGDILIDKAIKVDAHAYCVRFALNHVFVGCCEGVVKICSPDVLTVAVAVSLDQLLGAEAFPQGASKLYLDTTAIAVNEKDSVVTCIYANCSIYSWQINSFTDSIECSVLLPQSEDQLNSAELDSCVNEGVCRANMFRSFMGCMDITKGSRLLDTETLAARNGMRCHHGLIHMIKGGASKNQHATAYRFSPDGRDVICGNEAGEIKVFDASSGVLRRVIEAHSSQVMCIELMYDSDYQLVCSGGRDRIIFILNAKTDFSLVQVLCDHSAAITAISLVSHGGLLTLVSAAADSLILVRRATPGNSLKFTVTGQIVESRCNKALNVAGDYIITGDKNGNIKLFKADPIFNPKHTKTLKTFPRNSQATSLPRPMCMDPTGSFIATTQNPGQIVVYHLQTGQAIATLSGQTDSTAIKFTNCLRYMISSTSNGCTMIWRLPERMTEFLLSKRNKAFEVEIAKETTYETTYVSCVKVCKETGSRVTSQDSDQHQFLGSNHNYESDATPSIESLSFLRVAHNREKDTDRHSICSTGSYVSCSTCTGSCSDTVHWCPSSDSSVQTNSGNDRFYYGAGEHLTGQVFEYGLCKRVGPFGQKSSETASKPLTNDDTATGYFDKTKNEALSNKDDILAGYFNKTIKNKGRSSNNKDFKKFAVGDFKKDDEKDTKKELLKSGLSELRPANVVSEVPDLAFKPAGNDVNSTEIGGFQSVTAPVEVKTTNIRRIETRVLYNASENNKDDKQRVTEVLKTGLESVIFSNPLQALVNTSQVEKELDHSPVKKGDKLEGQSGAPDNELIRRCLGTSSNSSHGRSRQLSPSSPKSILSYRTACSPGQAMSKDTSFSLDNSDFFSPSPCLSVECDQAIPKIRSASPNPKRCEGESAKFGVLDISQDVGGHSSFATFAGSMSTRSASSTNAQFDSNITSSLSDIMPVASPKELVTENSIFKEIQQVLEAERKNQQVLEAERKNQQVLEAERKNPQDDNVEKLNNNINLPLDTGKFQQQIPTHLNNSIEGDLSSSECTVAVDLSKNSRADFDIAATVVAAIGKRISDEREPCGGRAPNDNKLTSTNFKFAEDDEVYNYHSITRDEHGKLRRVHKYNAGSPQSPISLRHKLRSPLSSPGENYSPKDNLHPEQTFQESTVYNIQCCRCSHKDDGDTTCSMNSNSVDYNPEGGPIFCPAHASTTKHEDNSASGPGAIDSAQMKAINPEGCRQKCVKAMTNESLEEYFSELRQCLQLTNTQETVYKLACDAQDQELMELLELVLKKQQSPIPESLNFQQKEIEAIRRNLIESETSGQQQAQDRGTRNSPNSKAFVDNILTQDKKGTERPPLSSATNGLVSLELDKYNVELSSRKLTKSTENVESNETTARTIINLVGQLLNSRKAAQEQKMKESVECAKTEGKCSIGGDNPRAAHGPVNQVKENETQKHCTLTMQQYLMRKARNSCSKQQRANTCLCVLKEKDEDPSLHEDSSTDNRRSKTSLSMRPASTGMLFPSKAQETNQRHSFPRLLSADRNRKMDPFRKGHGNETAPRDRTSHDITRRRYQVPRDNEEVPHKQMPENMHLQSLLPKADQTREPTSVHEGAVESRAHKGAPTAPERKSAPPIVEFFRDQDDYLKKLKEVREKFELSIQALSNERKSRLAEEEKQLTK